jgi:hypothetical protein
MASVTLREARGLIGQLMDVLSGDAGQEWSEATKRFLRKENPWGPIKEFAIFMTVTLGLQKSWQDYEKALKRAGFRITDFAWDILKKMTVSSEQIELDIVVLSVAELGFKNSARRDQIYARALELGFQLCPATVGPVLRLACKDQLRDEWFVIAMEPIVSGYGSPSVFSVGRRSDGQWMHADSGNSGDYWDPGFRWAFVQPRKAAQAA